MRQAAENLEPAIYAACLAAYNRGLLHGAWIAVEDDADAVRAAIAAMLAASPVVGAEEWAIHDHEGFGGVAIGEYAAIDRVVEVAAFLRRRGRLGALVLDHLDGDLGAASTALDEQYHGLFDSLAEVFQSLTEDSLTIPAALQAYIDWDAMARDAELNGEVFTLAAAEGQGAPGAVHVFWNR